MAAPLSDDQVSVSARASDDFRARVDQRLRWLISLRSESGSAELGISSQIVGRIAAVIFTICGILAFFALLLPIGRGAEPFGLSISAGAAVFLGITAWYLPWDRWPRGWTHLLVPIGFGLIGVGISFSGEYAYAYGAMFCVCFTAVGIAHRRGTALIMLPLFAAAYVTPIAIRTRDLPLALSWAAFIGVLCVIVSETVAWITAKLHRSQLALLRTHGAVNDIGAALISSDARGLAWSASTKLSRLLDVPQVSVYSLSDGGSLTCLAGIVDDQPEPRPLSPRPDLTSWEAGAEAAESRQPVLRRGSRETTLVIPLVARDRVVGFVEAIEMRRNRRITRERLADARSVCHLIALSIQDAEALAAKEAQNRRLASLLESSQAVTSADNLEDGLAIITHRAAQALGVNECVAYEYMREVDAIVPRAMWEEHPTGWNRLGEVMRLLDYPTERALLSRGVPLLENVSDPGLDENSREAMLAWKEKSCLTVPMRSADGPMGLLVFWDSRHERSYASEEMAVALALAELAGESVRRARLVRNLQRLSGTDSLTGLANHRQIHEILAREQARAERYELSFNVVMLDIDGFKLLNDTYGHPCGDTALRHIASILVANARASDVVGRYGGDEFMLILSETDSLEAHLVVENMRAAIAERPFLTPTGEQIPIHASFGIASFPQDSHGVNELVVAADSNLYVSKRRGGNAITGPGHADASDGCEKNSFGILESMVTAVDSKDKYTRRHSEQVTELALLLGSAMGLSDASLRVLRAAGLLHDVGKIGIPDRILRKPGPLTAAEWAIVKGHPAMGETLIRTVPDLAEIQALVACHHESFDGTGYPRGLAGVEIPLLARILTVADSYSAMITDRPYRKALTRETAISELKKGAGSHFDPGMVTTFVQCLECPANCAPVRDRCLDPASCG